MNLCQQAKCMQQLSPVNLQAGFEQVYGDSFSHCDPSTHHMHLTHANTKFTILGQNKNKVTLQLNTCLMRCPPKDRNYRPISPQTRNVLMWKLKKIQRKGLPPGFRMRLTRVIVGFQKQFHRMDMMEARQAKARMARWSWANKMIKIRLYV
jgi:hypothetical protein